MAGKRGWNAARNARQRLSTCPTGSSLHRPRLKGVAPTPRVVTPATRPYRSAHSASSIRGTAASPTGVSAPGGGGAACCAPTAPLPPVIPSFNLRPQHPLPLVDVLVSALDLADVVDHGVAQRLDSGQQHRHPGADV